MSKSSNVQLQEEVNSLKRKIKILEEKARKDLEASLAKQNELQERLDKKDKQESQVLVELQVLNKEVMGPIDSLPELGYYEPKSFLFSPTTAKGKTPSEIYDDKINEQLDTIFQARTYLRLLPSVPKDSELVKENNRLMSQARHIHDERYDLLARINMSQRNAEDLQEEIDQLKLNYKRDVEKENKELHEEVRKLKYDLNIQAIKANICEKKAVRFEETFFNNHTLETVNITKEQHDDIIILQRLVPKQEQKIEELNKEIINRDEIIKKKDREIENGLAGIAFYKGEVEIMEHNEKVKDDYSKRLNDYNKKLSDQKDDHIKKLSDRKDYYKAKFRESLKARSNDIKKVYCSKCKGLVDDLSFGEKEVDLTMVDDEGMSSLTREAALIVKRIFDGDEDEVLYKRQHQ